MNTRSRRGAAEAKDPQSACMLCGYDDDDVLLYGELFKGKITAHHYCMLSADGLPQNGQDNEGYAGFLAKDISYEMKQTRPRCYYCHQPNARVRCMFGGRMRPCGRFYHFPCLIHRHGLMQFFEDFRTLCPEHRPTQKQLIARRDRRWGRGRTEGSSPASPASRSPSSRSPSSRSPSSRSPSSRSPSSRSPSSRSPSSRSPLNSSAMTPSLSSSMTQCPADTVTSPLGGSPLTCPYCMEVVGNVDDYDVVLSPCCKRGIFHRECLQNHALSAGRYFFRCAMCNNNSSFLTEMLRIGINVPVRDAVWELEDGAFEELLTVYEHCDAEECLCSRGRDHVATSGLFRMKRCDLCGQAATHLRCGDHGDMPEEWTCSPCAAMLAPSSSSSDNNNINNNSDINNDDDDSTGESIGPQDSTAAAAAVTAMTAALASAGISDEHTASPPPPPQAVSESAPPAAPCLGGSLLSSPSGRSLSVLPSCSWLHSTGGMVQSRTSSSEVLLATLHSVSSAPSISTTSAAATTATHSTTSSSSSSSSGEASLTALSNVARHHGQVAAPGCSSEASAVHAPSSMSSGIAARSRRTPRLTSPHDIFAHRRSPISPRFSHAQSAPPPPHSLLPTSAVAPASLSPPPTATPPHVTRSLAARMASLPASSSSLMPMATAAVAASTEPSASPPNRVPVTTAYHLNQVAAMSSRPEQIARMSPPRQLAMTASYHQIIMAPPTQPSITVTSSSHQVATTPASRQQDAVARSAQPPVGMTSSLQNHGMTMSSLRQQPPAAMSSSTSGLLSFSSSAMALSSIVTCPDPPHATTSPESLPDTSVRNDGGAEWPLLCSPGDQMPASIAPPPLFNATAGTVRIVPFRAVSSAAAGSADDGGSAPMDVESAAAACPSSPQHRQQDGGHGGGSSLAPCGEPSSESASRQQATINRDVKQHRFPSPRHQLLDSEAEDEEQLPRRCRLRRRPRHDNRRRGSSGAGGSPRVERRSLEQRRVRLSPASMLKRISTSPQMQPARFATSPASSSSPPDLHLPRESRCRARSTTTVRILDLSAAAGEPSASMAQAITSSSAASPEQPSIAGHPQPQQHRRSSSHRVGRPAPSSPTSQSSSSSPAATVAAGRRNGGALPRYRFLRRRRDDNDDEDTTTSIATPSSRSPRLLWSLSGMRTRNSPTGLLVRRSPRLRSARRSSSAASRGEESVTEEEEVRMRSRGDDDVVMCAGCRSPISAVAVVAGGNGMPVASASLQSRPLPADYRCTGRRLAAVRITRLRVAIPASMRTSS